MRAGFTAWAAQASRDGADGRMNAPAPVTTNEATKVAGDRNTPAGDNNVDGNAGAFGCAVHPDHAAHAGAAPLLVHRDDGSALVDKSHASYGSQAPRDMRENGPNNTGLSS